MNLQVRRAEPNGEFPNHKWDLFYGKKFIAYAKTRLGAEWAKNETAKLLPAMPDPMIPAKALTDEERKKADAVAHFEQINGVVTIDRRNDMRPGASERLICWRLSPEERWYAFRYGVVGRSVPV